jgi:hypothetical protein
MPLTSGQKLQLQASVQTLADDAQALRDRVAELFAQVNVLQADAVPAPPAPTPPAPVPEPPPAPPPPATPQPAAGSYRVWPGHPTKATGSNAILFNAAVWLRWKNLNGDWLDRDGTPQGPVPWYELTVPINSAGYVGFDVTDLARRWHAGENRGATLSVPTTTSQSAWAMWSGTFSASPPQLVVKTADGGEHTITGDLAGFILATLTATTPPSIIDSGLEAKLTRQYRQLLHFHGLKDVPGEIVSAELLLHAKGSDDVFPLVFHVYETDAPPLILGGGGVAPTLGLAALVGEANLPWHPSVICAGDYREENWNGTPGTHPGGNDFVIAKRSKPAKLFNWVTMTQRQYDKTSVHEDSDYPGSYYIRTCVVGTEVVDGAVVKGNIGGGELARYFHEADMTDPLRPLSDATREDEVYVRCDVFLEPDSFWSDLYAFKFSPVGMDLRYGLWDDSLGWNNKGGSIYTFGSGQTDSDGRRSVDTKYSQWLYKGHSIRGHTLGWPHRTDTAYPNALAVGIAPSHLGPYDNLWDGGIYGTEQNLRIGRHCIPMGRWVTMESYCKVNSIDMSAPDANGNGVARNDGIWRMWMDGVLAGERTNLAWRRHPHMGIRGNWQMCYHGGSTPPNHDIYWRLRNFAMAREYIGPRVA